MFSLITLPDYYFYALLIAVFLAGVIFGRILMAVQSAAMKKSAKELKK